LRVHHFFATFPNLRVVCPVVRAQNSAFVDTKCHSFTAAVSLPIYPS
jgi:hypothetical protein